MLIVYSDPLTHHQNFVFSNAVLCSFRSLSVFSGCFLRHYDINTGSYWTEKVEEGTVLKIS